MPHADPRGRGSARRRSSKLTKLLAAGSPPRGLRERLLHEALEDRVLLDARLNLFVNGVRTVIPQDVGTATGLVAPVHTHDVSGELHFDPTEATSQLPGGRAANLGDFFQVWRTNAGNAGNNANATFTSTNLLGNQTDANHVIRMFVNGVANTQFENYVLRDNDEITILYDTVQSGASASGPVLIPIDNYYTTTVDRDNDGNVTAQHWGRADGGVDLLSGSPLYLQLDGFDPTAQAITYTVTSDNPNVTTYIPQNNRSMRINVNNFGTMTFQLFDDRAPRATNRIAELAESGFYNNILFHRVIDNFMIQGGDPLGTGTGGSELGDFKDQFHVDLQHNRTGLLSMAKSDDDTNDSQFFLTDLATRHLDFNHTIFGMIVAGDFIRDEINHVPVGEGDKPTADVIMESVEIFTDTENGVLMIKAAAGFTGTAHITVTAHDSDGNTMARTFTVHATPDTIDSQPFLPDFNTNITTPYTTPVSGQLTSIDADPVVANPPTYGAATVPDGLGWEYTVGPATGEWTFTPQSGFAGLYSQLVGVRSATSQFDVEEMLFTALPPAQATAGQAYTVDVQTPEELYSVPGVAYTLANQPQGMTINATTGVISWTPAANQGGTHHYEVHTTNTAGSLTAPSRTLQFSVTVPGSVVVPGGVDLRDVSDSGSNNTDNITNVALPQFTVSGVVAGAVVRLFNGSTLIGQATASGTTVNITATSALTSGSNNITATQQPSGGQESGKSASLFVEFDNTPPGNFTTIPADSAITGRGYVFDMQSSNEGQAGVSYSLQNAPAGMAIAASTGLITWVPTTAQNGNQTFTVRVSDAAGNVRTQNASINVAAQTLSPLSDFHLNDVNPNSSTSGQSVSPRDELGHVSAWYLIHST
ncbi:MAG: peptidylprolyl isomerase [Pirellulales bacterium]